MMGLSRISVSIATFIVLLLSGCGLQDRFVGHNAESSSDNPLLPPGTSSSDISLLCADTSELPPPNAGRKYMIDDFTEVKYDALFPTNGYGMPTYGGCNADYSVCTSSSWKEFGAKIKTITEAGMNPLHVIRGKRTTQFNLIDQWSQIYMTISNGLSWGNDSFSIFNQDSVSFSYDTCLVKSKMQEFVFVVDSADNTGWQITVEISDGNHHASLSRNVSVSPISNDVEFVFLLSEMVGSETLSQVISSVKVTLSSGPYGMDSGSSVFFAR